MRSKQKNRRGSILVMVALLLAALMGVTAIAADIGRFYAVAGELQTAADAAALKGANVLADGTTANFETTVDDSVTAWASNTNRSDGSAIGITQRQRRGGVLVSGTPWGAGTFRRRPPARVRTLSWSERTDSRAALSRNSLAS